MNRELERLSSKIVVSTDAMAELTKNVRLRLGSMDILSPIYEQGNEWQTTGVHLKGCERFLTIDKILTGTQKVRNHEG